LQGLANRTALSHRCDKGGERDSNSRQWRRPGAEFGGDARFLNDAFPGKISIFTPKISDDLLLVIVQVFQIFRIFTVFNVEYHLFFTRETAISENNSLITPFFTLLTTPLLKILGEECMGRPPPQTLGGPSPQSP